MNCPACHKNNHIVVYGDQIVKAWLDEDENVEDFEPVTGIEWDDDNSAEYTSCYWSGTVGDLLTDEELQEEDPS